MIERFALSEGLISPYTREQVNPHSYDLLLGNNFKITNPLANPNVDSRKDKSYRYKDVTIPDGDHVVMQPLQFVLACTLETVNIPSNITGFAQGKSTIARNGLQVEAAGLCDAGFVGQVTLELFNMSPWPLKLSPGMRICHITFEENEKAVFGDYSTKGHYCGQTGARLPAYYL